MKQIILIIALACLGISAHAQYGRFKGATSYQVNLGFSDIGIVGSGYWAKNFDSKVSGLFGGGAIIGKVADINYKGFFIDGIGSYNVHQIARGKFFVNAQAGLTFILDTRNKFASEMVNKQVSFNYGVLGGLEAQFMATRSLSFVLNANFRYYIKEEFGNTRYQGYAGIRYSL